MATMRTQKNLEISGFIILNIKLSSSFYKGSEVLEYSCHFNAAVFTPGCTAIGSFLIDSHT